jgi:hypothetical protein
MFNRAWVDKDIQYQTEEPEDAEEDTHAEEEQDSHNQNPSDGLAEAQVHTAQAHHAKDRFSEALFDMGTRQAGYMDTSA